LIADRASDEAVMDAVLFLDALPAGQRGAGQDLLVSLLSREWLGSDARVAILREIWQLGAGGSAELLEGLRAVETDSAALAFLESVIR
jgi:hypothetical protein